MKLLTDYFHIFFICLSLSLISNGKNNQINFTIKSDDFLEKEREVYTTEFPEDHQNKFEHLDMSTQTKLPGFLFDQTTTDGEILKFKPNAEFLSFSSADDEMQNDIITNHDTSSKFNNSTDKILLNTSGFLFEETKENLKTESVPENYIIDFTERNLKSRSNISNENSNPPDNLKISVSNSKPISYNPPVLENDSTQGKIFSKNFLLSNDEHNFGSLSTGAEEKFESNSYTITSYLTNFTDFSAISLTEEAKTSVELKALSEHNINLEYGNANISEYSKTEFPSVKIFLKTAENLTSDVTFVTYSTSKESVNEDIDKKLEIYSPKQSLSSTEEWVQMSEISEENSSTLSTFASDMDLNNSDSLTGEIEEFVEPVNSKGHSVISFTDDKANNLEADVTEFSVIPLISLEKLIAKSDDKAEIYKSKQLFSLTEEDEVLPFIETTYQGLNSTVDLNSTAILTEDMKSFVETDGITDNYVTNSIENKVDSLQSTVTDFSNIYLTSPKALNVSIDDKFKMYTLKSLFTSTEEFQTTEVTTGKSFLLKDFTSNNPLNYLYSNNEDYANYFSNVEMGNEENSNSFISSNNTEMSANLDATVSSLTILVDENPSTESSDESEFKSSNIYSVIKKEFQNKEVTKVSSFVPPFTIVNLPISSLPSKNEENEKSNEIKSERQNHLNDSKEYKSKNEKKTNLKDSTETPMNGNSDLVSLTTSKKLEKVDSAIESEFYTLDQMSTTLLPTTTPVNIEVENLAFLTDENEKSNKVKIISTYNLVNDNTEHETKIGETTVSEFPSSIFTEKELNLNSDLVSLTSWKGIKNKEWTSTFNSEDESEFYSTDQMSSDVLPATTSVFMQDFLPSEIQENKTFNEIKFSTNYYINNSTEFDETSTNIPSSDFSKTSLIRNSNLVSLNTPKVDLYENMKSIVNFNSINESEFYSSDQSSSGFLPATSSDSVNMKANSLPFETKDWQFNELKSTSEYYINDFRTHETDTEETSVNEFSSSFSETSHNLTSKLAFLITSKATENKESTVIFSSTDDSEFYTSDQSSSSFSPFSPTTAQVNKEIDFLSSEIEENGKSYEIASSTKHYTDYTTGHETETLKTTVIEFSFPEFPETEPNQASNLLFSPTSKLTEKKESALTFNTTDGSQFHLSDQLSFEISPTTTSDKMLKSSLSSEIGDNKFKGIMPNTFVKTTTNKFPSDFLEASINQNSNLILLTTTTKENLTAVTFNSTNTFEFHTSSVLPMNTSVNMKVDPLSSVTEENEELNTTNEIKYRTKYYLNNAAENETKIERTTQSKFSSDFHETSLKQNSNLVSLTTSNLGLSENMDSEVYASDQSLSSFSPFSPATTSVNRERDFSSSKIEENGKSYEIKSSTKHYTDYTTGHETETEKTTVIEFSSPEFPETGPNLTLNLLSSLTSKLIENKESALTFNTTDEPQFHSPDQLSFEISPTTTSNKMMESSLSSVIGENEFNGIMSNTKYYKISPTEFDKTTTNKLSSDFLNESINPNSNLILLTTTTKENLIAVPFNSTNTFEFHTSSFLSMNTSVNVKVDLLSSVTEENEELNKTNEIKSRTNNYESVPTESETKIEKTTEIKFSSDFQEASLSQNSNLVSLTSSNLGLSENMETTVIFNSTDEPGSYISNQLLENFLPTTTSLNTRDDFLTPITEGTNEFNEIKNIIKNNMNTKYKYTEYKTKTEKTIGRIYSLLDNAETTVNPNINLVSITSSKPDLIQNTKSNVTFNPTEEYDPHTSDQILFSTQKWVHKNVITEQISPLDTSSSDIRKTFSAFVPDQKEKLLKTESNTENYSTGSIFTERQNRYVATKAKEILDQSERSSSSNLLKTDNPISATRVNEITSNSIKEISKMEVLNNSRNNTDLSGKGNLDKSLPYRYPLTISKVNIKPEYIELSKSESNISLNISSKLVHNEIVLKTPTNESEWINSSPSSTDKTSNKINSERKETTPLTMAKISPSSPGPTLNNIDASKNIKPKEKIEPNQICEAFKSGLNLNIVHYIYGHFYYNKRILSLLEAAQQMRSRNVVGNVGKQKLWHCSNLRLSYSQAERVCRKYNMRLLNLNFRILSFLLHNRGKFSGEFWIRPGIRLNFFRRCLYLNSIGRVNFTNCFSKKQFICVTD